MLRKLFLLFIGLLSMGTALFAMGPDGDQEAAMAAALGMGVMAMVLIFFVVWLIVSLLFIMSQNKLIDALAHGSSSMPISKVWTWTQLIPVWSIVALIVSIVKLSAAYKEYVAKHGESSKPYNPTWGWIMIGSWVISLVFAPVGFVMFIFWIIYWVNIAGAHKAIAFRKEEVLTKSQLTENTPTEDNKE